MNTNILADNKDKHSLILTNRNELSIDGVIDVLDFDSTCINIKTCMGIMSVEGTSLKIISMSKEDGKLYVEGNVDSIFYFGVAEEKKGGFFKKRVK